MNETLDMNADGPGFSLEPPRVGIIKGVLAKDIEVVGEKVVNLRTCARPYRNVFSAAQLRALARVMRDYGSGKVHVSPRHNLEIPEVRQKDVDRVLRELYIGGLFPGGAGSSVRNVFTCPVHCTKALRPVQELGTMISKNFGDQDMPNKVTISLAGCVNGCPRPHNTDIGAVAIGRVAVSKENCPTDCRACEETCPVQAVERANGTVRINDGCIDCGFCARVCPHGVISLESTGFRVYVGGKEGSTVRFGEQVADCADDFTVLEITDRVLSNFRKKAMPRVGSQRKKERIAEVVERLGIAGFMTG